MSSCKNCGAEVSRPFCSECGQKGQIKVVNFQYVLEEIVGGIFQVDYGFFYTVKELFARPGHSIRQYLQGKRIKHFKPISFAFLLSTIYTVAILFIDQDTLLGEGIGGFVQAITDAAGKRNDSISKAEMKLIPALLWFKDNYAYTTLFLVPLFTIGTYVSFLGKGYNYFEHLILNLYVEGQKMIVYLIFVPFLYAFNEDINDILQMSQFIIGFLMGVITFVQFFKNTRIVSSVSRWILSYVLFYFMFMILFPVVVLVVFAFFT